MSRRHQEHKARLQALSALGRPLIRRAGGACELCATSGVPLRAVEVEPAPEEPELDETGFLCDRCKDVVAGGHAPGATLRFLEASVWSEVGAVQVLATRLLRRLAGDGEAWAAEVLEGLYLAPEVQARLDSAG